MTSALVLVDAVSQRGNSNEVALVFSLDQLPRYAELQISSVELDAVGHIAVNGSWPTQGSQVTVIIDPLTAKTYARASWAFGSTKAEASGTLSVGDRRTVASFALRHVETSGLSVSAKTRGDLAILAQV